MHRRRPLLVLLALLSTAACSGSPVSRVEQAPMEPVEPGGVARDEPARGAPIAPAAPTERAAVRATPEGAAPAIAKNAALVPALDAAFFRDGRRLRARAMALIVVELQQLEMLLQATPAAAPDRPALLRRLAEDYVELEKAARGSAVDRARTSAIRYYTALADEYAGHPSATFPAAPPAEYAQLDEVTYYLAYEHERAGDLASARRAYLQLIQRWPASRYVPRAYLAFGDLFFGEAMSDASKWDLAGAAYAKVLTAPPPANDVYGYAWYRLAYVVANQGDQARALEDLRKAADWATAFPQAPGAAMVGAEASAQMKSFAGASGP